MFLQTVQINLSQRRFSLSSSAVCGRHRMFPLGLQRLRAATAAAAADKWTGRRWRDEEEEEGGGWTPEA